MNVQSEEQYFGLYKPIYSRNRIGCFKVFSLRDAFLLDLSSKLVNKLAEIEKIDGNFEDDFALSQKAKSLGLNLYVCNRDTYGYLPDSGKNREESFIHLRIEHLLKGPNKTYNEPLRMSEYALKDFPKKTKTKLGFDQIYVINLERRPDRLNRIQSTLEDLNLDFKVFKAIDGKSINEDYIKNLGIKVVPNYRDPYYDRSLNYGEIGCFLSHYFIWQEVNFSLVCKKRK